jgi:protein-tyrosine phosphatase
VELHVWPAEAFSCSAEWEYRKLIILMAFGYRMEAISILGREVMQPRGLAGLGYDCIDHSGLEIAQVRCAFTADLV